MKSHDSVSPAANPRRRLHIATQKKTIRALPPLDLRTPSGKLLPY